MASTQPLPSPSSQRPKSRPGSLRSASGRTKSLRIPHNLVDPPIPPSLLAKPSYLTSPRSIFRRTLSSPRLPSQEDEEWLRDTVPLSWEGRDVNITLGSTKSLLSGMVVIVREEGNFIMRGRSKERGHGTREAGGSMSSPPLVRKRLPKTAVPARTTSWFQRTTCLAPPRYNTTASWPWYG